MEHLFLQDLAGQSSRQKTRPAAASQQATLLFAIATEKGGLKFHFAHPELALKRIEAGDVLRSSVRFWTTFTRGTVQSWKKHCSSTVTGGF